MHVCACIQMHIHGLHGLQSVLPVALPEDIVWHIASFLDIDTRRALGMPPGRLPPDRYAALKHLTIPVIAPCGMVVLILPHPNRHSYLYKRMRLMFHHRGGLLVNERLIHSMGGNQCQIWRSCELVKWV